MNLETLKQNQRDGHLATRVKTASKDLHQIMKDLQRDCKPYWKFSELERELLDIAHEAGKLTADLAREVRSRKTVAKKVREVAAQAKKNMEQLKA